MIEEEVRNLRIAVRYLSTVIERITAEFPEIERTYDRTIDTTESLLKHD